MSFGNLDTCSTTSATTGSTLVQLIALGACDTALTANPEVTLWRMRVQKCTNFAMESVLQTFTGQVTFGSEASATLNRTGDLIHWQYILVDIPGIVGVAVGSGESSTSVQRFPSANPCNPCYDSSSESTADLVDFDNGDFFEDSESVASFEEQAISSDACSGLEGAYANWVNEIGFAVLQRVSYSIGGQIIDTVYSHFLHMWEELSGQPGKRLEEMIGKRYTVAQLVADSQHPRRLYVPLPFSYTRDTGNALPLVSLQFHNMQVHACFAQLHKLIQVSSPDIKVIKVSDGLPITAQDINALLQTTYVYLDMEERDRFAVGSFQQLITQVQQFSTTSTSAQIHATLNFNHPTLELMWAVQRKCQLEANNTFNYSGYQNRDPILRAQLRINNLSRFDREAPYFRLCIPWQHHTNIPKSFIYNYSFAVLPESPQPSGSLNFSRIDNVDMQLQLQPELFAKTTGVDNMGGQVALYVFARSFNILRFREGLGGLSFSN